METQRGMVLGDAYATKKGTVTTSDASMLVHEQYSTLLGLVEKVSELEMYQSGAVGYTV